jgi:hypothetical protein
MAKSQHFIEKIAVTAWDSSDIDNI